MAGESVLRSKTPAHPSRNVKSNNQQSLLRWQSTQSSTKVLSKLIALGTKAIDIAAMSCRPCRYVWCKSPSPILHRNYYL